MGLSCSCFNKTVEQQQCNLGERPKADLTIECPTDDITMSKGINLGTSSLMTCLPDIPMITSLQSMGRGYLKRKHFTQREKKELMMFTKEIYNEFINDIAYNPSVENIEKKTKDVYQANEGSNQRRSSKKYNRHYGNYEDIVFHNRIVFSYKSMPQSYDVQEILNKVISVYKGDVDFYNEKNGKGTLIKSDGSKFIGTWIKDKFTGWNKMISNEGIMLIGNFNNGILNGKGESYDLEGKIYKGNFANGIMEGYGVQSSDKATFEGTFKNGHPNGKGKIFFSTGDTFEGTIIDNQFEGQGHYIWRNGREYIGEYLHGKFHGRGLYKINEKEYYDGEYQNGVREGMGELTWDNNAKYIGMFRKGHPHGIGFLNNGKGFQGEVEYQDGKLNKKFKSSRSPSRSPQKSPNKSPSRNPSELGN